MNKETCAISGYFCTSMDVGVCYFEPGPPVNVPERNNFLATSPPDSGHVLFCVIDVLLTTEAMARS